MPRPKNAVEVTLPDGRKVVLVELSTGELRRALELADRVKPGAAREYEQQLQGIRLSVREINGNPVKYADLDGDRLDDVFSARDVAALSRGLMALTAAEEGEGNVRVIARS